MGEDCWRGVDGEAYGACTDCGSFEFHINDEFGGFDTLSFAFIPDAEPARAHALLDPKEVLCTNCFDRVCEEAEVGGKVVERHDGLYLGTAGLQPTTVEV